MTAFIAAPEQQGRVSERAPATVEVVAAGIVLKLRFKLELDNLPDVDVDIDCTIRVNVIDGELIPSYKSFSVDADWPWWFTGLTGGASKILEEIGEEVGEGSLRARVLEAILNAFSPFLLLIPPTHRLHSVQTASNRIDYTGLPGLAGNITRAGYQLLIVAPLGLAVVASARSVPIACHQTITCGQPPRRDVVQRVVQVRNPVRNLRGEARQGRRGGDPPPAVGGAG